MTDPKDARIAELEARILALETVTDEDVERAAKATFLSVFPSAVWEGLSARTQDSFRHRARAALSIRRGDQ